MKPAPTTSDGPFGRVASRRWSVVAEWSLYALLTAVMLHQTWLTWPDAYVDFGREIYNAWRISEGEMPYRDIAHYSGLLSMCVNGAFFARTGVSMHGLFALNFAIWTGIVWALWRILSLVATWGARVVTISLFIVLFSFARYTGNGNYTYLAPYAHELTHGLLLSLLALLAASRAFRPGSRSIRGWLLCSGTLLGLATLTKPEMALAGWLGVLAGIGLRVDRPGPARLPHAWVDAVTVLAAAFLVVTGAVAGLSLGMPVSMALGGVTLPWQNLFNREVTQLPFFKTFMGTDDVGASLRHMLPLTILFAGSAGIGWMLDRCRPHKRIWAAAGVVVFAVAWGICRQVDSSQFARPLPIFAGLATAVSGLRLWRRRRNRHAETPPSRAADAAAHVEPLRWMLGVFSLALLLKIILFARIWHYGFVLAAPAMVWVVAWSLDDLPRTLFLRAPIRWGWRLLVMGVLIYFGSLEWIVSRHNIRQLPYTLGSGGDRYRTGSNATFLNAFLTYARTSMPPGTTLSVLPEGAMLNYLLRLESPVPYTILMPPEVFTFGETAILDAFRASPPDYVLLLHKDTSEFGYRFFGRDYGTTILQWLRATYQPSWALGPSPFQSDTGGLLLLHHRSPAGTAAVGTPP